MEKDRRYQSVKIMIETGHVQKLGEIFHYIPKSLLAKELGIHNGRMNRLIDRPETFSIDELIKIAAIIDVSYKAVIEITVNDYLSKSKQKLKK